MLSPAKMRAAPLLDRAATQHFWEQKGVMPPITDDGMRRRLHGQFQPPRSRWPGVRRCMRANGLKLSKGCLSAPIAAGEVSKADVARRAAAGK